MKLSSDLSPRWIYVKGWLFLVILLTSFATLVAEDFSGRKLFLVCLLAWSSARFYYFMFYVIEKYVDPSFRFSGVFSFLKFMLSKRKPK